MIRLIITGLLSRADGCLAYQRPLTTPAWPTRPDPGTLVLLLCYTGLRWGEATALRVCDIDPSRRWIDVRRTFSDVGGRIVLGTPKSHQSRTVPLPRFLAYELANAVTGKHADDLVFTTPAAVCCGCPTGAAPHSCPPALGLGSAIGSGPTI